jgi:hypothetical protein
MNQFEIKIKTIYLIYNLYIKKINNAKTNTTF